MPSCVTCKRCDRDHRIGKCSCHCILPSCRCACRWEKWFGVACGPYTCRLHTTALTPYVMPVRHDCWPLACHSRRSVTTWGTRTPNHANLCQGRSRRSPQSGQFRHGRCPMNLQRLIEQYISFQRSLGSSCGSGAKVLRAFGHACGPRTSVASVRVQRVDAFLGKARPVTRNWFHKLSCLRSFFRYAVSRGYATTAPLPTVMPKRPPVFVPYIYSRKKSAVFSKLSSRICMAGAFWSQRHSAR